jgi:dTDP-4-amino-4,6-dideoxygalactose transaminase
MIEYENLAQANSAMMGELEAAASRVIRSGWYILGNEVAAFESEFAAVMKSKHCIGVANGLDALILSIEALDLPAGSEIMVASNTYIATILAIVRAGHKPVLVEPELETYNIDPDRMAAVFSSNTRAICVTHLFGKPCRMTEIMAFAGEHGLQVIEDCAQSHMASYHGQLTGTFGISGCFSFYPTKNLGALGDAGAIITQDDSFADRIRYLRNYGSKKKYENAYLGLNSRLDEIQAGCLRVKLKHLDALTAHKRRLAETYFANLPKGLAVPLRREGEFDVFHIFAIRHPRRDELREWLLENGVKTEIHYPIAPHRQKAMQGILAGEFPIADELHATELSLPISAGHTEEDVREVCRVLANAPFENAHE